MSVEMCDVCGDIDADTYYDCGNCCRHLCEPCYGDITLVVCKSCVKDPDEDRVIAKQKRFEPKGEPILPIVNARWQVRAFAGAMEDVLKKNDHKGGWQFCATQYLQSRLIEEIGEYFKLVAESREHGLSAQKELVDIANYCMMLWTRS